MKSVTFTSALAAVGMLAFVAYATETEAAMLPTDFTTWAGSPIVVDDLTFTLLFGPSGPLQAGKINVSATPTGLNFGIGILDFTFDFRVDTAAGTVLTGATVFDNSAGDATLSGEGLALRAPAVGSPNTPSGLLANLTSATFTFGVSDNRGGNSSVFGYGAYFDTADVSAVPLPAAWMLIAGLGGLAAVGRRRSSHA